MTTVALLDYGSGNLHSAARALSAAGATVVQSARREQLWGAAALVVPGVGAFGACMAGLRAIEGDAFIYDWIATGRPVLGICVGHQILFESGTEHGLTTPGLGILPGVITELPARPLPHMGWNQVAAEPDSRLFAGLAGERFYFVHSYAASPLGRPGESITTHAGADFVAAVEQEQITSTQFHPEKSGRAGARLLRNWLGA